MRKRNETRGIRFGELLEPLDQKAKALGVSRTDLVLSLVRKDLGIKCPVELEKIAPAEHGLSRACIRWGKTLAVLDARAALEGLSSSAIARKAVRLYVANNELPKVEKFRDELEQFRKEVAKIGNNLNQIAVRMHSEGVIDSTDLGRSVKEQAALYKAMMEMFRKLVGEFEQRLPQK